MGGVAIAEVQYRESINSTHRSGQSVTRSEEERIRTTETSDPSTYKHGAKRGKQNNLSHEK